MATKVGAFKKDGTVQCVKLVEEAGDSLLSQFNGTLTNNILTLNNGMKLEFLLNDAPASFANLATTGIQLCYYDTSSPYITLRSSNNKDFTATYTGSSTGISWESENPMYITGVFWYVPGYGNIEVNITLNGATYGFSRTTIIEQSNLNLLIPRSGDAIEIPLSMRVKPPTVRMCKDGTLKCKELIEESIINLIDDYSGTSASPYDKLVLNNGITLAVTKDGVPAENFFRTLVLQFSSAASTISPLFAISIMGSNIDYVGAGTAPDGSVPWEFKQDYPIDGYITVSTPNVYAAGQYVLTISDSTQSVNYSVTLDSSSTAFSFSPSTSGDYFILSYDMRMKVPTVRIGKDGTIRCAKVQEATVTKKFEEQPSKDANYSRFVFSNGYVLEAKNANSNELVPVETNSLWGYDLYHKDSSGNSTPLMILTNGDTRDDPVWTYTVYDEFYDPQYSINWCDCGSPLMGVTGTYLILYNAQGESVGQLNSTAYTPGASMHTAYSGGPFEIPMSDRISYSWPGSTPSVTTGNNLITSDGETFLTNTGDQFMVR